MEEDTPSTYKKVFVTDGNVRTNVSYNGLTETKNDDGSYTYTPSGSSGYINIAGNAVTSFYYQPGYYGRSHYSQAGFYNKNGTKLIDGGYVYTDFHSGGLYLSKGYGFMTDTAAQISMKGISSDAYITVSPTPKLIRKYVHPASIIPAEPHFETKRFLVKPKATSRSYQNFAFDMGDDWEDDLE